MPVYMIQGESRIGPIKIGHSTDPQYRLCQLQVSHWETLRIIRLFDGEQAEELMLHKQFLDLHIRGEWHSYSQAMLRDVGLVEIDCPRIGKKNAYNLPPIGPASEAQIELLSEVDAFLLKHRMAVTTLGVRAVHDAAFYKRLRAGRNQTTTTLKRVKAFMEKHDEMYASDQSVAA